MRDLFAAVVALVLPVVAASLGTTLTAFRRRRLRARDSERALGRTVVAEIPADDVGRQDRNLSALATSRP